MADPLATRPVWPEGGPIWPEGWRSPVRLLSSGELVDFPMAVNEVSETMQTRTTALSRTSAPARRGSLLGFAFLLVAVALALAVRPAGAQIVGTGGPSVATGSANGGSGGASTVTINPTATSGSSGASNAQSGSTN